MTLSKIIKSNKKSFFSKNYISWINLASIFNELHSNNNNKTRQEESKQLGRL